MSNKNYYEILEVNRNSTQEEIANSFRRLSLKFHPKRNSSKDFAINNFYFNEIAEAYEVLSDPNKRGVFDVYGEQGLKNGVLDKHGNLKGGYKYGGNSYQIFEKFIGTSNPFALIKDCYIFFNIDDRNDDEFGTMFGSGFGGLNEINTEPLKDIEIDLLCSLEELYNGGVKRLKYQRRMINIDGRTTSEKEEIRDIEIFPGYENNTVLKYPGYGNESPGIVNSDLIVKIKQKTHRNYKRNNNDLIYTHRISLIDALNSEPVTFSTLDGRTLTVAMDEIISPQSKKMVPNEGMPIYNKEGIENILFQEKKGNLFIIFDIIFPSYIQPDKKDQLINLLKG